MASMKLAVVLGVSAVRGLIVATPCAFGDHEVASLALLGAKARQLGVDCEGMCKDLGAYPQCNCPGFQGQPSSDDDMRSCIDQYCQDPASPCPNDAFTGCVKETTKVSALQFNETFSRTIKGLDSLAKTVLLAKRSTADTAQDCATQSLGFRALLQATATQLGVDCEGMCRDVGSYPNCDCPGFQGQPASEADARGCIDKYCQDPKSPCPNDDFVGCVKDKTQVSALQFDAVCERVSRGLDSLYRTVKLANNRTGHIIA